MRTLPKILAAALLVSLSAGSAVAVTTTVMPQAADWAGFVDDLGNSLLDEIATGGLSFAFFGDDARGYARFPLTSIPPGSTINSVVFRPWTCNHDNLFVTACAKIATVGLCTEDPLTSTIPQMWSAIGIGPAYTTFNIPRSGPAFCLDYYVQNVVNLGPPAIADVQAALPAGFITLGLQSNLPCDRTSDHIDWIGYSETIIGGDPGCLVATLPGSRIALDIDYTPPCAGGLPTPTAATGSICTGSTFALDGTPSAGCTGGYLYRWLDGPAVVCGWSGTPTCNVSPTSTTVYTLEVACAATPSCIASTPVTVTVAAAPTPAAASGSICTGSVFTLDGTGTTGCPVGGYLYRWLDGAAVVCGWSGTPTCNVSPTSTTVYTLEVACSAMPACVASAPVSVTVAAPPSPAAASGDICPGDVFTLDGTSSTGCPVGSYLYRWLAGAAVVCGWSSTPTCNVAPGGTTVYTLEVACSAAPTCTAPSSATVTVGAIPSAAAAGGNICEDTPFVLDGTPSTGCAAGGYLYRWLQGPAVVCGWSGTATCNVIVLTTTAYTLEVACSVSPTCIDTQTVTVVTRNCSMAVRWDTYDAIASRTASGPGVDVRFSTLEELDTNYFAVERADRATGPFVQTGGIMDARGAGYAYAMRDGSGVAGHWYRVVEYTSNGRGDETPPFVARPGTTGTAPTPGAGGSARQRVRGR